MRSLALLLLFIARVLAEENATQNFQAIDVQGRQDRNVFSTQDYLRTQTYLEGMPSQKELTITEAMSLPGVLSDPLKALQIMAGVSSPSSFSGELLIHGSKGYETFYTYNYLPLGYTFHLGGLHSVVSPDAIEQLNVYLGAFDVTYGNAMGGVIDITPKVPTGTNSGHVHIGLFDSSASIDYKLNDKMTLYIGGRRSYFDLLLNVVDPQIPGFNFTTYPNYYDLTTILSYFPNNENTFTLEAIVAKDTTDLTNSKVNACNPDFVGKASTMQSFRTYGARWNYDDLGNFRSNTVFAYTARKDNTDVFGQIQSEENFHDLKLTNTSTLELDAHKLTAGFEVTNYYHPYDYKLPATFFTDAEYAGEANTTNYSGQQNFINYALFAQDIFSLTENLRIRYGVRANYTPYQTFSKLVDPRAAIIYSFANQSISFAAGQYSQYPVLSRALAEFSDNDLGYERSIHYAFNYKYTFAEQHTLEIEPFHKEYTALSVSDGLGKYTMARQSVFNFMNPKGLGYAQGLDVTYKLRNDTYFLYATYSYLNANRQYTVDQDFTTFLDEVPHTLQAALSYNFSDNWVFGALARYRNGVLYNKPVTVKDGSKVVGEVCYKADTTTQVRLDDYFTLNLKATKTDQLSKSSQIEYSFELFNVTMHKNISGYAVDSKTGAIKESLDVLSFPFLPWFDITYRF